jgi:Trypsin-like peptidase domain
MFKSKDRNEKKHLNTGLRLITCFALMLINSCTKKSEFVVENTLVYLKSDSDAAFTGFIIARDNNKYYILTVQHGAKESQRLVAIPYLLREKQAVLHNKSEEFGESFTLTTNEKNSFSTAIVANLEGVDASIISFSTDGKLDVSEINEKISYDDQNLNMDGFVSCGNDSSKNRDYFHHKMSGSFFTKNDLESKENQSVIPLIKKVQEETKTDMKYKISAKTGMSGSPITDSGGKIIGMQVAIFLPTAPEFTVSNCTIPPDNKVSYGISMKKILAAKNFPEEVKKLMAK